MSREIKFKYVLDTHIGVYVTKPFTLDQILNFKYGIESMLEEVAEFFAEHDHNAFFEEDIVVLDKLQHTGLFDKKDVEVYDGDIIQGVMNYSKSKFKSNVFYNDGAFRVDTGSLICNATFEVIGNIYENPELLEVMV